MTEKHQSDIVSSNLKKGMEKDAVRGRQKREAAIGCKRLLPQPEPVTALEPPTDM